MPVRAVITEEKVVTTRRVRSRECTAERWDVVRRGARLVLSFDSGSNTLAGTVENTTEQRLCAIRVEVHLSTRTELRPTDRIDLPARQSTSVTLSTGGEAFESYTAHPELSPCGDN